MQKLRLLIVEDEVETWEAYDSLLGPKFHLYFTRNAEEAQEVIHSFEPLVVLTDLRLPGASGVDLLRFLSPYPEIARIVVTGELQEYAQELVSDLQVDRILEKPITNEKILIDAISDSLVCALSRLAKKV